MYEGEHLSRKVEKSTVLGSVLADGREAKSYARANIAKKRELLDRKVVQIGEGKRDDKGIRGR